MRTIVIGSTNRHKIEEIRAILSGLPVRLASLSDYPGHPEVEEAGLTFEANAVLKATEFAAHTGQWVIADDSGLEVDALGGRPGVHSARYSDPGATDEKNNQKLLREMCHVPEEKRSARYRCVIALASPVKLFFTVEGVVEGAILRAAQGDKGFGYDPLFYYAPFGCSFAQADPAEKNRVSHRAQALHKFQKQLDLLLKQQGEK